MRIVNVLLPLLCSVAVTAADSGFVSVAGGVHYPNADVRDRLDNNVGLHFNIGVGAYETALVGCPSFEMDWGHITGRGSRLDSIGGYYCERMNMSQGVYLGAGAGLVWNRLTLSEESGGDGGQSSSIRPSLRGMIGMSFARQYFIEAAAFYNGAVNGIDANALALLVGVKF